MFSALIVFLIVTSLVTVGALRVWGGVAAAIERKKLDERLREVGQSMIEMPDVSVIKQLQQGKLAGLERMLDRRPRPGVPRGCERRDR